MKNSVGGMKKETQQSSLAHDSMIQQRITEGSFSGKKMGVALQHYSCTIPTVMQSFDFGHGGKTSWNTDHSGLDIMLEMKSCSLSFTSFSFFSPTCAEVSR